MFNIWSWGIGMCIAKDQFLWYDHICCFRRMFYMSSFIKDYYTQEDFTKISKTDVVICFEPSTKNYNFFFKENFK